MRIATLWGATPYEVLFEWPDPLVGAALIYKGGWVRGERKPPPD